MPALHLPYGGSTAARTLKCAPWRFLSDRIPQLPPSDAAAEGSLLHGVMERSVRDNVMPVPGVDLSKELYDEKFIPANRAIRRVMKKYSIGWYEIEPFVELIPKKAGGSIDFIGISTDGSTLVVADYKFGYHLVFAENNAQMLFYALSASVDPQFQQMIRGCKRLVLTIIQPGHDDCVDEWVTPIDVLDDFEDQIYKAIDAADASDGTNPTPGDHCKFCPAQSICTARFQQAEAALRMEPQELAILEKALPLADAMESWIKDVRKQAHAQLERGASLEGYKLVNKRATRVWSDEDQIEKVCKRIRRLNFTEYHKISMLSPAQLEKVFAEKGLDRDQLKDYIVSVSSGTTLAAADDPRPEAVSTEALKARAKTLLK